MKLKNQQFLIVALLGAAQAAQASWFAFPNQAPGAQKLSISADHNRIDVSLSGFEFNARSTKGGQYSEISLENIGFTNQVGQPKLPVIRKLVEVPADAAGVEILSIESKTVAATTAGLSSDLMPVQLPVEKTDGAEDRVVFQRNETAYKTDAFFPNFQARVSDVGSIRGRNFATVEVAPVRYNPATNQIEYISHISLRVKTLAGAQASTQQFSSTKFDSLLPERQIPGSTATQEKLLIIVGRGFENSPKIAALVQDKQELGLEVLTTNVSGIGNNPVAVRNYIKSVYSSSKSSSPLTYVILVGDVDQIPVYNAGAHVTDNYYACVDKPTYDEDKTYPDLAVGRLTVQTSAELQVVVDKILRYDHSNFTNRSWIKKIAFLATDDRYEVAEGTHNYVIDTYTFGLHFSGLFPSTNQAIGGDKLYAITYRASTDNVFTSIDDGRLIVSYSGHGAPTYWAGPHFGQDNIRSITNSDALPYVMSHACVSGSYAMSGQDSFGETWLKEPKGGIGFWGTSNSSYWDEDDILERTWFDGMFRDHLKTVGLLNLIGKQGVRTHYGPNATNSIYYYEIYNLLGDPTTALLDH